MQQAINRLTKERGYSLPQAIKYNLSLDNTLSGDGRGPQP